MSADIEIIRLWLQAFVIVFAINSGLVIGLLIGISLRLRSILKNPDR